MMYHNTLYRHVLKSLFSDILSRFTFLFFSSGCVCVCGGGGGGGGGMVPGRDFSSHPRRHYLCIIKRKEKKKQKNF